MTIANEFKAYAEKIGFPNSETMERILAILFPDEPSQKIFRALKKPARLDELAEMTGIPIDELKDLTYQLYRTGAISRYTSPAEHFRLYPGMIELRDATVVYPDTGQELFDLWEILLTNEMANATSMWKAKGGSELLRVVPIDETIASENLILDIDSARQIFKNASVITAVPCPCRLQSARTGRTDDCPAPKDLNLCMQTNKFAQDSIARGIGEQISNEEALRRLDLAEKAGLVHQVRNNVKEDMIICNCCSCCCTALYLDQKLAHPSTAKSRFRVSYDESLCNGCGICVKRCHFQAIDIDKTLKPKERTAQVDYDKCYGCGVCAIKCPTQALTMIEVRPREAVRNT